MHRSTTSGSPRSRPARRRFETRCRYWNEIRLFEPAAIIAMLERESNRLRSRMFAQCLARIRRDGACVANFVLAALYSCSYTVITMATKTRIVRIGNSRGIRIPKTLLDEADLPEDVELHAQPGRLVVQAARRPRSGWAAAAKRMRARGEDRLLDESTATKFDREEWEWR
jgi:antitoxin MazE